MLDLEAIELIKQLKARYFRFLDTGDVAGLKTVFTDDGEIHYRSPSYDIQHKAWPALENFFSSTFTSTKFGMHTVHHPEITTDGDTAEGIWYLHDIFISLDDNIQVEGSAIYKDRYLKENGEWKIAYSSYDRLFEQMMVRNDSMTVTSIPVKR